MSTCAHDNRAVLEPDPMSVAFAKLLHEVHDYRRRIGKLTPQRAELLRRLARGVGRHLVRSEDERAARALLAMGLLESCEGGQLVSVSEVGAELARTMAAVDEVKAKRRTCMRAVAKLHVPPAHVADCEWEPVTSPSGDVHWLMGYREECGRRSFTGALPLMCRFGIVGDDLFGATIVGVRLERLQSISLLDIERSGIRVPAVDTRVPEDPRVLAYEREAWAREQYAKRWNSTAGRISGHAWKDNPWTWALTLHHDKKRGTHR